MADLDWDSVRATELVPFQVGPLVVACDTDVQALATPADVRLFVRRSFGSGAHPTTRLMLDWLAEQPRLPALLDVGAGSGILAIVAVKLGAPAACAWDNDAEALREAQDNVTRNRVGDRVRVVGQAPEAQFPLLLANILAAPLIQLAPTLVPLLAPSGTLVLSGVRAGQAQDVARAYTRSGLRLRGEVERDGWSRLELGTSW